MSKPLPVIEQPSTLITPAIIRRNLKTEIYKNSCKIRSFQQIIGNLESELYNLRLNDENLNECIEIEEQIDKHKQKIFRYETHNIILQLHLETAAPGKYLNKKNNKSKLKSRNTGLSTKSSTGNLSKYRYDCKTTEGSTAYFMTKQSNISEEDLNFNSSILSISNERELVF